MVLKLKTSEFSISRAATHLLVPPDSCEELTAIALSLRERIDLGPAQRFRLVGVGLSNFRDVDADAVAVIRLSSVRRRLLELQRSQSLSSSDS